MEQEALRRVKRSFKGYLDLDVVGGSSEDEDEEDDANEDSDDELMATATRLSLRCPLGLVSGVCLLPRLLVLLVVVPVMSSYCLYVLSRSEPSPLPLLHGQAKIHVCLVGGYPTVFRPGVVHRDGRASWGQTATVRRCCIARCVTPPPPPWSYDYGHA